MNVMLSPVEGPLVGAIQLVIHKSLYDGLTSAMGEKWKEDPFRCESWADSCENPTGQKAALARMIAQFIRASGKLQMTNVADTRQVGFWEATAR